MVSLLLAVAFTLAFVCPPPRVLTEIRTGSRHLTSLIAWLSNPEAADVLHRTHRRFGLWNTVLLLAARPSTTPPAALRLLPCSAPRRTGGDTPTLPAPAARALAA